MTSNECGIEFVVTLTPAEVFQASMALTWRGLARMVGILGILAIVVTVWNVSGSRRPAFDPLVASTVLVAVLAGPAYVWLAYRRSRRVFREGLVYRHPLSYVITEKGLEVRSPTFRAASDWSNVALARETRSFFILCPPTSAMTIIPKRCLPDPSSVEVLRELIRRHVSGRVTLNPVGVSARP